MPPEAGPPAPPPEALALRRAREELGLSPERAAARVQGGLSGNRWRQIEAGYRKDTNKPVKAKPPLLAAMARAVSLQPEDLQAANRADAAELLMNQQGPASRSTNTSLSELVKARRKELDLSIAEVAARSLDLEAIHPAPAWTEGELSKLEAGEGPAPTPAQMRGLMIGLTLPLWRIEDATGAQFHGLISIWNAAGTKRIRIQGGVLSAEQVEQIRRMLDEPGL